MQITDTTTIADVAGAIPSSIRVFQRHGIDFCCGGRKPLADVCRERNLSLPDVVREIDEARAAPERGDRDWAREPLDALIRHIVSAYHDPLRAELPRLADMAAKVARVHGAKAPELARLEAIVVELTADLLSHMRKEEMVLFPAIDGIERGTPAAIPISAPIAVMDQEHDHAGALLAELREITGGYVPPGWGCATCRALYSGLEALEAQMHVHVHLENNILFPRALARAGAAATR